MRIWTVETEPGCIATRQLLTGKALAAPSVFSAPPDEVHGLSGHSYQDLLRAVGECLL